MKKLRLILCLSFIASAGISNAQENITVTDTSQAYSTFSAPSFSVFIPQAARRDVVSGWKKFLRKESKNSAQEKNGEITVSDALFPSICEDTLSLSSIIREEGNGITLVAAFRLEDGNFLTAADAGARATAAKAKIREFAVQAYKDAVADELKKEQKSLDDLNGKLKSEEHKNEQRDKKTKENERKIDRNNSEMKIRNGAVDTQTTEIVAQQQLVNSITQKSDVKSEQEKKLKEMEKQKKKMIKEIDSMAKDNDNMESENKQMKKDTETSQKVTMPSLQEMIRHQEEKVKSVQEKFNAIR